MKDFAPRVSSSRRIMEAAWILIFAFFGVGGVWASTAPLARGVLAPGTVGPEGSRRTIQHRDGGVIEEILVDEGDVVRKGEVVMRLVTDDLDADLAALWGQIYALHAEQDRLEVVRLGKAYIQFRQDAKNADLPDLAQAAQESQRALFYARRDAMGAQTDILQARIAQLNAEITGLKDQVASLDLQKRLVNEELESIRHLVAKGHERKTRLLSIKRTAAQLTGERGARLAEIARAQQAIGEANVEIIRLTTDQIDAANTRLAEIQAELPRVEQEARKTSTARKLHTVHAPVSGTVIDLKFRTLGGVVAPGEQLMDIVPDDEDLVIEARIQSLDIDTVRQGMEAEVVLSAYPRRTTPRLSGRVTRISADVKNDEEGQSPYYSARIIVNAEDIEKLPPDITLYPGMPTENIIRAGDRTALGYLIEPLIASFQRSFAEP